MKLEVQSKLLQESLQKNNAISDNPYYMQFKLRNGQLSIFSNSKDYNQYIFTVTPVMSVEDGSAVIEGGRLYNLVKTMDGNIGISIIDESDGKKKLQLMYRKKKYKFDILDQSQVSAIYPKDFMEIKDKNFYEIRFDRFFSEIARMSNLIKPEAKENVGREWQECARIRLMQERIIADVCLSTRFVRNNFPGPLGQFDILLRHKNVVGLSKIFNKGQSASERLIIGSSWVCFANHDTYFFSGLPSFEFPKTVDSIWQKLVQGMSYCSINTEMFKEAINRCVILTEDGKGYSTNPVKLNVSDGVLEIEIAGQMHEEIEITNTNNINMFWYYPPYQIMEVLKNISSVETSLMFSNQKHLIISDLNGYDVIISPKSDESIKN